MNITATSEYEALHHWPDAPRHRGYLAHPHRHMFGLAATVTVDHHNRDVEFHDLADDLYRAADSLAVEYHPLSRVRDFGSQSCEGLATMIARALTSTGYDVVAVAVTEDTESTATWTTGADQ